MLQIALEPVGPACKQELLLAHFEEIARAGRELVVVDGALQEIRRARLQGLKPELAVLVDRDDHDRQVVSAGSSRIRRISSAPSICGIL